MAFVALTAAYIIIQGVSGKRQSIAFTKATAVGMVTFTRDSQTFCMVNEPFYIVDAYTADNVNAADYIEIYMNGMPTTRRIPGGIMETAPTGANRLMEGLIPKGQLALYWSSA